MYERDNDVNDDDGGSYDKHTMHAQQKIITIFFAINTYNLKYT